MKKMNKMIVLPLFLGIVTLASAGVLGGVHALTNPIVTQRNAKLENEGLFKVLDIESADDVDSDNDVSHLSSANVKRKTILSLAGTVVGVVYYIETTGWSSGLNFQLGLKDNIYAGFNVISENETPGYGKDFLPTVNEQIKGKSIDEPLVLDFGLGITSGETAATTGNTLLNAFSVCVADYKEGKL